MDDQKNTSVNPTNELDDLLKELAEAEQKYKIKNKVLFEKANQLARKLEATDFSELEKTEKAVTKELRTAIAEEIALLEEDERGGNE